MERAYDLPESMRSRLAKPLGRLYTSAEVESPAFQRLLKKSSMVITVGDRVTEIIGEMGRTPDVQVVDGKERRENRTPPAVPYARLVRATNPPGKLTTSTISAVRSAFRGRMPVRLLVEGEEDLVAIPVIALAPVSAIVFYGQPGKGMVAVRSDARSKARSRAVLARMGITQLR